MATTRGVRGWLGLGLSLGVLTCARGGPPSAAPEPGPIAVIPLPASVERHEGVLALDALSAIAIPADADADVRALADYTADVLRHALGRSLPVRAADARDGGAVLRLTLAADAARHAEGYALHVAPTGVEVAAATHAGLFYGLQTVHQLAATARAGVLPAVAIRDEPRFGYRGMHLDVGRHFFPVAFVKRYIDLLARYKLNTFHWHLTEDQGWRIEIERYPRLTEVASCRKETILEKHFDPYVGDGIEYCGFYTQDEVREVVAYAASRYVTVIPEIEMPGHSVAALAAYPELACTEGPFEVATVWGVHPDIFCPKEETFAFLENVLTEVMALFPGTYIHIGGDEAPKTRWEASPVAQEVIRREGLADEHELQSWFIRRIERFLLAHGRRLIGWDEILEGGLAPEATVMSWRGMAGGIEAAKQGHDVIMTPTSHAYFDYYQGDPAFEPLAIGGYTPLDKVYRFEPVPDELTPEEARHVLGAQGNVWTEYMKTPAYVEYMVVPRMLALAEVVWSPRERRDWDDFVGRLGPHFALLADLGVNYHVPAVDGLGEDRLTLDGRVEVALRSLMPDAVIRYTTDGSDPTAASPAYDGPVGLTVDEAGTVVTARVFLPDGRASTPRAARYRRAALRPADPVDPAALAPGLAYRYYEFEQGIPSVDRLAAMAPAGQGTVAEPAIGPEARAEQYGYVFEGYVTVPTDAIYAFALTSDDGSRLWIGDRLVVDHDGPHGATEERGMVALAAGTHPLRLAFFQNGGGQALGLALYREGDGAPVPLRLSRPR